MIQPSGKATISLRREIRSSLAEIHLLCAEIRALLLAANLENAAFATELLARESLCNGAIHGNMGNLDKKVSLEICADQTGVCLQVTDEGNGFNWRTQCSALRESDSVSGRGIHLYALYADRMEFNEIGNQITLWISTKANA